MLEQLVRFGVRAVRARYRDQKAELRALRRYIRAGGVVCDVGANKGSYIYWLARWSRAGKVVAFEPQPSLARRLSEICATLGFDHVVIEPKAVSSVDGMLELFVPNGHQPGASLLRPSGPHSIVSVPAISLDTYFGEESCVTALKIDVEGAELQVLHGANRMLRRCRPLIVVECENRHQPGIVEEVFAYLGSLGYRGSFINGDQVHPIERFDADIHQRQDGEWFWKKQGYCNNFIFEPEHSITAPA